MDARTLGLIGVVLLILGTASAVVRYLKQRADAGVDLALVENFRVRLRAWWLLFAGLAGALLLGRSVTVLLFGLIGFWALREFITLTPTRPGDHRTVFWVFFLCTPLQFALVGIDSRWFRQHLGMSPYNLYSILIPVYAFLFIPVRIAMSGDSKRFLERTAKIQAGLLVCVYCLSYAPALLTVDFPQVPAVGQASLGAPTLNAPAVEPVTAAPGQPDVSPGMGNADRMALGGKIRLLFFFVLMVQLSDALQYAWSRLPSRHVIVPTISPARTWEGLLGGSASVTLLGTALWFATPFPHWWQAALISLVVALMSFCGGLTMSAVKRDRGVKDYGTLVEGHGGVLDRIDSICFSAPAFFHLACLMLGAPK